MSLISAGQAVGQMAAFGGGGRTGRYGYYQPNQWAMAGRRPAHRRAQTVRFRGPASDRAGDEHRQPTLEIRPGYEFNVMVTEDLAFPGPYKG